MIIIGAVIILLLDFRVGEFVGYRKAGFSRGWAENYHRNFGGPRPGFFGDLDDRAYTESDGTFGPILKINLATTTVRNFTFVVEDANKQEKTVVVSDATSIRLQSQDLKAGDLKVDDRVLIIGDPTDKGQIDAKFIRVFR